MERTPTSSGWRTYGALIAAALALALAAPSHATPFAFSTGNPDGRMATASRPDGPNGIEIESADDFVLAAQTVLSSAAFVGLLPSGLSLANISNVIVEIYRVFPLDSSDPPSGHVPTRVNSPSDIEFVGRDGADASELTFSAGVVNTSFTATNSVVNGVKPVPRQFTGG